MLEKSKFYWFSHGLMISQKNINKSNIKWFTTIVVKYVVVQFSQKNIVFWPKTISDINKKQHGIFAY